MEGGRKGWRERERREREGERRGTEAGILTSSSISHVYYAAIMGEVMIIAMIGAERHENNDNVT